MSILHYPSSRTTLASNINLRSRGSKHIYLFRRDEEYLNWVGAGGGSCTDRAYPFSIGSFCHSGTFMVMFELVHPCIVLYGSMCVFGFRLSLHEAFGRLEHIYLYHDGRTALL